MKKLILTLSLLLISAMAALAVVRSQVVVYIGGVKYYIHTVEPKETIYSIARTYGVSEQEVIENNSAELKAGEKIKIPFEAAIKEEPKESAVRNLFAFSRHTITKGETLYSISRKYEISIDAIIEDNPSIDPISLPVGEKLNIRKKMKGRSSEHQSRKEWETYRSNLNSAVERDGYQYHIVQKGETIYSLSRGAQISEEELIKINDLRGGLKAGSIIKIPTQEVVAEQKEQEIEEEKEDTPDKEVESVALRSLKSSDTLRIALFLPLSHQGTLNRQFAEFYKGFIIGLDSVRIKKNRNIELKLYNTDRKASVVERIVKSEEFKGVNLIVGPIYEELLPSVIEYAERNSVAVVSPLATLKKSHSNILFQLAPPVANRYEKLKPMLAETRHTTLIYTEQTDSLFEKDILALMGERPYDSHTYVYEHPNEVAEKLKDEEESAGDLSKFINNGKDNTIVIMSSSQTDVDRVLSALSSAQINIVARGGKEPRYEVLGNAEWNRYKNIDRTVLFKNNVVISSSYHAKRDNDAVKNFDSSFIKKNGSLPTLYAYRGYDVAMIFGEALYSDMEYGLEGRTYTPLHSSYKFEVDPTTSIHVNGEWVKVKYNSNYTISIE